MPSLLAEAARRAVHRDAAKDQRRHRVGCVIMRADGACVSASNGSATAVTPSVHAEARCLRKADVGGVAYVARVLRRDSSLGNARPCPACRKRLLSRGIRRVVYTASADAFHEEDLITGVVRARRIT